MNEPYVYILAGPNGTGKTTFAETFLPQFVHCERYVNADWIAKGLSAFNPAAAALRAGRIMWEELRRLAAEHTSFSFETTLSGRTYVSYIRELRSAGYSVHLVFLWPGRPEITLERIAERVRAGGHDTPEADVRRRFMRTLRNLFQLYMAAVDSWTIIDNSAGTLVKIAYETAEERRVLVPEVYVELERRGVSDETVH